LETIIGHLESVVYTLYELQDYDNKASIGN